MRLAICLYSVYAEQFYDYDDPVLKDSTLLLWFHNNNELLVGSRIFFSLSISCPAITDGKPFYFSPLPFFFLSFFKL